MAIKRKKSGGGGANWMDTYGDMVTLLLCFFVLLYSMCTISEEKWRAIVASFNPNAVKTQTEINAGTQKGPSADDDLSGSLLLTDEELMAQSQEEIDEALDQLFKALQQYAQESDSGKNIQVTKGDGYVFVSFNDAVFFDGDSYNLRSEGEKVLQSVAEILSSASEYIDEVVVMGHTAQGSANRPNTPRVDRFLSSNRATIATLYIQEHSTLDPARIVSESFGQWRPVAGNENGTERAKNRRVELMISGKDLYSKLGDSLERYETIREGGADLQADRDTGGTE